MLSTLHDHDRIQPGTSEAKRYERQESQIAFLNDYVQHTTDIHDSRHSPTHQGSALFPNPCTA